MLLVGLTGGIGSGKSEVARRLAAYGAVVVDADMIAHDVVAPGTEGLRRLVEEFGTAVLDRHGALDRARLAREVFSDADARARLNAIVHPLVGAGMAAQTAAAAADPHAIVVHDVPLLAEGGLADRYDVVVVVDVDPPAQLSRLLARGMSEEDARARISVQATREQRLAVADIVIDNTGDLDALDARVREVWTALAARAGRTRA